MYSSSLVLSTKNTSPQTPQMSSRTQQSRSSVRKTQRSPDPEIVQLGQDLVAGNIDPQSIELDKCNQVISYLKQYKEEVLKQPDYYAAQRIDDISAELILVAQQKSYCGYRSSEIDSINAKIKQAKSQLKRILDERKRAQDIFDDQKQKSIEKLEKQQQEELQILDEKYSGELPPRFRKFSAEALNIRRQEISLKQAKRYIEAQEMREEAEALEAFEMARQEIRFHNEGAELREKMIQIHKTQMYCLLEKLERQYQTMMPNSYTEEKKWRIIIANYEEKRRKVRSSSRQVQIATTTILTGSNETNGADTNRQTNKGLPSLNANGSQTPMRRMTTMNAQRAFTRSRARRPKSSFI